MFVACIKCLQLIVFWLQVVVNGFFFFVAGARASLHPFLSFFFRYLGFTATQTGILIGLKTFLSVISTPVWTSCAIRTDKKRTVMMMSVFILMVSSLFMSVVPSKNKESEEFCLPKSTSSNEDNAKYGNTTEAFPHTVAQLDGLLTTPTFLHRNKTTVELASNLTSLSTSSKSAATTESRMTRKAPIAPEIETTPTVQNNYDENELFRQIFLQLGFTPDQINDMSPKLLEKLLQNIDDEYLATTEAINSLERQPKQLSDEHRQFLLDLGLTSTQIEQNFNDDEFFEALNDIKLNYRNKRNVITSSMDLFTSKLTEVNSKWLGMDNNALVIVVAIIVIGELFSCSVEAFADNLWFDFVDNLDMIEKYGSHRRWEFIGWIFTPILVTFFVDYTDCTLVFGAYHFNIHFYVFAGMMGIALIWGLFFPVYNSKKKVQRHVSTAKGFKVLCIDFRGFSFCTCVFLLGLATAVIDNFLMWQIQDLGGTEMILGGAVTIGAFTSLVMQMLLRWVVYKIGNTGAIMLSFICLTIRLIVYAYLQSTWAVLGVAFLQAFSHTLLLGVVENYTDFKVNPYVMDRSAKAVLRGLYVGVAYVLGSVVSGVMYDTVGLRLVYQCLAVAVVSWSLIFVIIQRCKPHSKKVRYARLLQAEEDQVTDEFDSDDDDWLKSALKHEK